MSFPYPQDRNRDRREKGEQPYKDAREAMAETEASMQAEAEEFGESRFRMTEEERQEQLRAKAEESMRRVADDPEHSQKKG